MAGKDPAVLWYWNDWHGGTITLSRHLKGCYMDLLHAQFNQGNLSLDEIKIVLGSDFGSAWPTLQKKFKKNEVGLYYNERLVFESDRRKTFSSKQKERGLKGGRPKKNNPNESQKENEIENEIVIDNSFKEKGVDFEKVFSELISSVVWQEAIAMQMSLSTSFIQEKLTQFLNELKLKDDYHKGIREIRSHFINWIKKEKEKVSGKKESKTETALTNTQEAMNILKSRNAANS